MAQDHICCACLKNTSIHLGISPLFFHRRLLLPEEAQLEPSDSRLNAVFITFFYLTKIPLSPGRGGLAAELAMLTVFRQHLPAKLTQPWPPCSRRVVARTAALPGASLGKGNEFPPGCRFSAESPFGKLQ